MRWILAVYRWFWHDLLKLNEPISWIIVHSIKRHLIVWDLIGGTVLAVSWFLLMHFIAMN